MSAPKDDGGPAFPQTEPLIKDWQGMTLLDYFAGQAMQGMLSNRDMSGPYEDYANRAYVVATAMIKARPA